MALPSTSVQLCNMALSHIGWTDAITALDADENKADRQCNLFYYATLREMMELFAWNCVVEHRPLILTEMFEEYYDLYGGTPPTISAISQADPAVITATLHGFETGQYCEIYDVTGMTEINTDELGKVVRITDSGHDTITLSEIDSTNFTAYSSGGSMRRRQPQEKWSDSYTYDIPSDFVLGISLEGTADEYDIIVCAGNKELITLTQHAILTYIKTLSDDDTISDFNQLFFNVFSLRLGMKLAIPMIGAKGGMEIKKDLKKDYKEALYEAQAAEAKSINLKADTSDPFITCRN